MSEGQYWVILSSVTKIGTNYTIERTVTTLVNFNVLACDAVGEFVFNPLLSLWENPIAQTVTGL
jgi:hypothetical protein